MISRVGVVTYVTLSLSVSALAAQGHRPGEDPLARALFPPELVLQHAEELGLRPEQRTAIVDLIKATHAEMLDFQLAMGERSNRLMKELGSGPTVNENAVLRLVDSVLTAERDMKRHQMLLLIRVKNALSKEQQDRLQELRKAHGSDSLDPHQLQELRKHQHGMGGVEHHGVLYDHGVRSLHSRPPGMPRPS